MPDYKEEAKRKNINVKCSFKHDQKCKLDPLWTNNSEGELKLY